MGLSSCYHEAGSVVCNLIYYNCLQIYNRPSPFASLLRETQNLRTIIVIADIHPGLYSSASQLASGDPPYLTFGHWSGVTPYTSSYEFAGSCVFGKQLPGIL